MGDKMNLLQALLTQLCPPGPLGYDATIQVQAKWFGPIDCGHTQNVEKKRREALMSPDEDDAAATEGFIGVREAALIGAHKVTIVE
jgi:hypothetical protein